MNSALHALKLVGIPAERGDLLFMIGPPLLDSFTKLAHGDATLARRCVTLYREYYTECGIFENRVYDGVPEMLQQLLDAGCRLGLATSKPEPFALRILEHFDLARYFSSVAGADMKGPVQYKPDILKKVLALSEASPASSLMVGDRFYDIEGAHAVGLSAAGVLYGYGSSEELRAAEFLCADTAAVVRTAVSGTPSA